MLDNKGHPNRLGIWGWLGGGRWGIERYLYTLHRLTGLGLLLYFLLHIVVTSARAFGRRPGRTSMGRGERAGLSSWASSWCSRVRLPRGERRPPGARRARLGDRQSDRAGLPVPHLGARTAAAGARRDGAGRPARRWRAASTSSSCTEERDHARSTTLDVARAGRRRHPRVPRPAHGDHAPRRARRDLQPGRSATRSRGRTWWRGPGWGSSR